VVKAPGAVPVETAETEPADATAAAPGEGDAEEAALVERVRHGDAAAFDLLVGRYLRRAFGVAYRLMGQREDAEDLVQETFMAVLQRIGTFEAGRPFAPWFFRILVNRGLNARKARSLRTMGEIPGGAASAAASPEREAERSELRESVQAALDSLPGRQRTIVRLFELEGFTSPEIAEILEISEGTVRWHLHEARKTLRRVLAPYERRSSDE
jgi:RNA polymerase sigma-70 factor (ECF subfamily)